MAAQAVERNGPYPPLDIACHDARLFLIAWVAVGLFVLLTSLIFATAVEKVFLVIAVCALLPFISAFMLFQHLMSLRIMQAEYATARPERRHRIEAEVE